MNSPRHSELHTYLNHIDGNDVPPAGGQFFPTENPYDGNA